MKLPKEIYIRYLSGSDLKHCQIFFIWECCGIQMENDNEFFLVFLVHTEHRICLFIKEDMK